MIPLHKPVKRAQRRLWLNRWLAALGWVLAIAAGLFIAGVVIERIWVASEGAGAFFGILAAGLAGGSLLASLIWMLVTRDSLAAAAAHLDLAAGLKERVSTGLYCQTSSDPFARAVVADAERISRGISIKHHMPVQVPHSANYAGGAFLVALLVFWLFPTIDLAGKQEQRLQEREQAQRIAREVAVIKPIIDEQMKELREKNPLLKKELGELEPIQEARLDKPFDVRQEAVKKVGKLRDKLQNKRDDGELTKVNEFKKMLRRLASQQESNTPVGKLTQALAKGDFQDAQKALEAIKAELSKPAKTEEEKKQADELRKQLNQLSTKINQLAQNEAKTQSDLTKLNLDEKEIEQILKSLKDEDFEAVKKQLADKGISQEQIDEAMKQMKKRCSASSAACKLGQCLSGATQGSDGSGQMSPAAADALSAAGEQLSEMESLQQELSQLSSAISDLEAMKDQLSQGCAAYNGTGMGPGMGKLGQGQGNIAPEQATNFGTAAKRTRVNTLPGRIISQKWVDGEQYKGEVSEEFVEANIAAQREVTDAIAREQIPRIYHRSIKDYFTRSRAYLPADKVEAAENNNSKGEQ